MSISDHPDVSGRAPERRNHRRVLAGAPAWLLVGDQRFSAECFDLSIGGAGIFTEQSVLAGSVVRLELSLGMDRGTVTVDCEVVRGAETELGLRFLALDRASLEAIGSLL